MNNKNFEIIYCFINFCRAIKCSPDPFENGDLAMSSGQASSTLAGHVFERLRDDLKSSRFMPGERLKFDEMRQTYEVGVSPLREALFRLKELGLVAQIGQKGFRAAEVSREDLVHIIANRRFLEERALEASLINGDERWENAVVAAFHQLSKATRTKPKTEQEYLSWERHHTQFHMALVSGCGSAWLLHAWGVVFDQAERYRRLAMKSGHWIIDQKSDHSRLLDAALARDVPATLEVLRSHIGRSAELFYPPASGGDVAAVKPKRTKRS
jgi:GntR family carbon starvation induced transcriptional regulator